eukprot:GHVP01056048.1.p2 GENE.GHVP01056048.1~~GHVP01056048.1.p2  ORF type:complete len:882 (+),score=181.99 GHVP01056048.1:5348-7993(+)
MSSKYFGKGKLKKTVSSDSDEEIVKEKSKEKDVGGTLDKWVSKSPKVKKETDNLPQIKKPKAEQLKEENDQTVANFFNKRPSKSKPASSSSASSGTESSESVASDPPTEESDNCSVASDNSGRKHPVKRQRKSSETDKNMKPGDRPKRIKEQTASPKAGGKSTPKAKASPKSKLVDRPAPTGLAFDGMKFCVTGAFESTTREDVEENVKRFGGQVMSAVSSRTDYLVAGSVLEDGRAVEESGKYKKAEAIVESGKGKIKFLREDEFLKMLPEAVDASVCDSPKSPKSPKSTKSPKMDNTIAEGDNRPAKNTSAFAMWTDKWKPMTTADLIGNSDSVLKLKSWLRDWRSVVVEGKKKEVSKPSFRPGQRFQEPERINARGALLSGSPGIGKSSAARVVCKELGFNVIEMNASDDRGKSIIEVIRDMTSGGMNLCRGKVDENMVLIMDEVDGLAGGDRGGAQALGKLIDDSLIPVICICNDRLHPKVKTLASRCYDLRFSKPPKNIIAQRLAVKAAKEGLVVEPNAIESLCESNGNDIRLIVNNLQLKSKLTSRVTYDSIKSSRSTEKDIQVTMSPFDVAKRVLTSTDYKKSSFSDLLDYFFVDYDLMPLLMNENYLNTLSNNKALTNTAAISKAAEAADSFAFGDVLNKSIRMDGNWGLLPEVAVFTLIIPGAIASGFLVRPEFPRWLGKNSTQGKNRRLLAELSLFLGPSTTTSMSSLVRDGYLDLFYNRALSPLVNDEDVKGCMNFMDLYGVTKDQVVESMGQLKMSEEDLYASVNPKTKASFTKTYKASSHLIRMAPNLKKSQRQAAETADEGAADGSAPLKDTTPPAEEEDDIEEEMKNIDRLIKEKSKKNKATSSPKKKAKAKSPKTKAKAKSKSKD